MSDVKIINVEPRIIITDELFNQVLSYAGHKYSCDWLQPMWHQGPCDCGWEAIVNKLYDFGLYTNAFDSSIKHVCPKCKDRELRRFGTKEEWRAACTNCGYLLPEELRDKD